MNEEKQNNSQIKQSLNESSKKINHDVLKWIIIGLAGFAVIILIFSAGMFIGGMKARFSYRWAEEYHRNFAGPQVGFFGDWQRDLPGGNFIESHGVFGEIIELNDSGFVAKGRENIEIVIVIMDDTIIKRDGIAIKDGLKVGDLAVIIGSPNQQGQIEAKLIRIFNQNDPQSLQKPLQLPF
ncbi:hypothetical protein D4R42_03625 [bacterium]|nr:MAG: hypothetical protein D4R42_03625 [bacterium]